MNKVLEFGQFSKFIKPFLMKKLANTNTQFFLKSSVYLILLITLLLLYRWKFDTSPSGGAGYAAIKEAKKYPESGIDGNSKILIILTEKPA